MSCFGYVLIVDDDPDVRAALGEFIDALGCTTALACDGVEAIARLDSGHRPCLVLLDLNMPRLDGEGFAEHVRREAVLSDLPIISMSAGSHVLRPPLVHTHLTKPFAFHDLVTAVERFCRAS
ncbi:MAG TPA: response regulator [Anaeromyxobacteraceae bacterium]